MRPLLPPPLGSSVPELRVRAAHSLTKARALLDRPLDLDRDPPLHRQREQLAWYVPLCAPVRVAKKS